MKRLNRKAAEIMLTVIVSCVIMAFVETVIEPLYWVKSALKAVFFLAVPLLLLRFRKEKLADTAFSFTKKTALRLLLLGLAVYSIVMTAYYMTSGIFDYSKMVESLSTDQNVAPSSFIWVALYISFGNSLLEEFMFRQIAFIKLSEHASKAQAYIFSSVMFAIYHLGMISGSFPPLMVALSMVGLTAGGMIFDFIDNKDRNILNSWIIHMFADFAIMTIWYLNIH